MAEAVAKTIATKLPFTVGKKELYLPNFRVILKRSHLPPTQASFVVPLWFSKLDLRDYLYHAYNVETTGIRSYVRQSRVQQGRPGGRFIQNRWHRPRATKHMTVDLVEPFVWPEGPESYADWNKEQIELAVPDNKKMMETMGSQKDTYINKDRRVAMREQAKALLEGREKWKSGGQS
ncbi:Hypothetical protein R9X50_00750400 [Acrodontium crateriforme]|uniref:Large ribosomal subunit protein uL23m n=1 Tax=Acrodontium crateriforme TaxID=150365 RepID=A0AAQ3MBK9_9PEZI|nr:Hypothetical protein R9X50_00750400 [Acrodontium crateriforme]